MPISVGACERHAAWDGMLNARCAHGRGSSSAVAAGWMGDRAPCWGGSGWAAAGGGPAAILEAPHRCSPEQPRPPRTSRHDAQQEKAAEERHSDGWALQGAGGSPAVVTLAGGGAKAVVSLLMVAPFFCSQQASSGEEAARPAVTSVKVGVQRVAGLERRVYASMESG